MVNVATSVVLQLQPVVGVAVVNTVRVKPKYRRHPLVSAVDKRYIVTGGNPDDPVFAPTNIWIADKEKALTACLLCNAHSRALVYEFHQIPAPDSIKYCVREYRNNRKGRKLLGYVNIPATLLAFQQLAKETSHLV